MIAVGLDPQACNLGFLAAKTVNDCFFGAPKPRLQQKGPNFKLLLQAPFQTAFYSLAWNVALEPQTMAGAQWMSSI